MSFKSSRSLRFQSLEGREVMAGNVTAVLSAGSLKITGDGAGNGVQIKQISATSFDVIGISQDGSATKINGKSHQSFTGVKYDIVASMGNGNDRLDLLGSKNALVVNRNLTANLGNGNDTLNLSLVRVKGDLSVDAGAGSDKVNLSVVQLDRNGSILLGAGIDTANLNTVAVSKTLKVNAGADNDTVKLQSVWAQNVNAYMGSGNDSFASDFSADRTSLYGDTGRDTLTDLSKRTGNYWEAFDFEVYR